MFQTYKIQKTIEANHPHMKFVGIRGSTAAQTKHLPNILVFHLWLLIITDMTSSMLSYNTIET